MAGQIKVVLGIQVTILTAHTGIYVEPDNGSSPLAHLLTSEDSHTTILNVRQVLSRDIERRWLEIYAVQRKGRRCYKHLELLSIAPTNLIKLFPS